MTGCFFSFIASSRSIRSISLQLMRACYTANSVSLLRCCEYIPMNDPSVFIDEDALRQVLDDLFTKPGRQARHNVDSKQDACSLALDPVLIRMLPYPSPCQGIPVIFIDRLLPFSTVSCSPISMGTKVSVPSAKVKPYIRRRSR